jgi:AraC family transcriptional activator of mtrCDE
MDGSLRSVTRARHGGVESPFYEVSASVKSNDALSALAPMLRVRPELRCVRPLGSQWLSAGETGVAGFASFLIVTSGACVIDLHAARSTIVLQTGEGVVLPRGADHRVRDAHPDPLAPARIVCGRLVFETAYHRLVLCALPDVIVTATSDGPEAARMCQLMQTFVYELDLSRQGASAIANDLATALVVMVVRTHLERQCAASGLLSLLAHRQASRAAAAMLDNLSRAWTLDELAACAHVSRASLVRMFRKEVKLAPLEFLLGLRMDVARRKLATSRATLGEIAAEIGYQSESAFSRAFRRRFGIPPGVARGCEKHLASPSLLQARVAPRNRLDGTHY